MRIPEPTPSRIPGNDVMRFDSGPLATKQSFSNTFTAAGRYIYTCKQYSFMKGTVLVE